MHFFACNSKISRLTTTMNDPDGDCIIFPAQLVKILVSRPHCLYRFLDRKKTSRSWFTFPGVWGIHRNLKQYVFFKKFTFCTFFCVNPGFGWSWDMLWKDPNVDCTIFPAQLVKILVYPVRWRSNAHYLLLKYYVAKMREHFWFVSS